MKKVILLFCATLFATFIFAQNPQEEVVSTTSKSTPPDTSLETRMKKMEDQMAKFEGTIKKAEKSLDAKISEVSSNLESFKTNAGNNFAGITDVKEASKIATAARDSLNAQKKDSVVSKLKLLNMKMGSMEKKITFQEWGAGGLILLVLIIVFAMNAKTNKRIRGIKNQIRDINNPE